MAHQALYRRYRPASFAELRGQEPVVRALQNAVQQGRVGHAYLFSGPRGTGKTSTARILAKALNCNEPPGDGEPCGQCPSCEAIAANTSYDLIELDAASNNKVDDIRDLTSRVAMGSPGRAKVYVLDEVHMLTPGAENALLKTLEEPPDHVVFVLCTTEPHKVVPTIRSRTQHLEFNLIDGEVLEDHARWVAQQAGLELSDDAIDHAVHRGAGSARDTLSALDQIAAAGGVTDRLEAVDAIIEALADMDYGPAFAAVHDALRSGREPRLIGEALIDHLRSAFLSTMGVDLSHLTDAQQERARAIADRISPAGLTRALEVLGTALVEMRQAPDPRVDLEVALARLTRRDLDTDLGAVVERLERLERRGPAAPGNDPPRDGGPDAGPPPPRRRGGDAPRGPEKARAAIANMQARQADTPPPATDPDRAGPPLTDPGASDRVPRPTLGATRAGRAGPSTGDDHAAQPTNPGTQPTSAAGPPLPSREELVLAWGDTVLANLSNRARVRFQAGRFLTHDADSAVFALPNRIHLDRCQEARNEVDEALHQYFGRPVAMRLVVDDDTAAAPPDFPQGPPPAARTADDEPEAIDPDELMDEETVTQQAITNLLAAFPGSEVVTLEPPVEPGRPPTP